MDIEDIERVKTMINDIGLQPVLGGRQFSLALKLMDVLSVEVDIKDDDALTKIESVINKLRTRNISNPCEFYLMGINVCVNYIDMLKLRDAVGLDVGLSDADRAFLLGRSVIRQRELDGVYEL